MFKLFKRIRTLERELNNLSELCALQARSIQSANARISFMENELGIKRPKVGIPSSCLACPRNG